MRPTIPRPPSRLPCPEAHACHGALTTPYALEVALLERRHSAGIRRPSAGHGLAEPHDWYWQFYSVFNRQGLILDVRHYRGGNIDSILLEKLLRRAWFYWKGRVQKPYWNMQYAFRGHLAVLCGKVIGTRTWGGVIWLSSTNRLTDKGIACAPITGVYDEDGD